MSHNCPRSWLKDLLKTLRNHGCDLPKDSRTLLQTPRVNTGQTQKCGGSFQYYGIQNGIIRTLHMHTDFTSSVINLQINIDGIPVWKSSSAQFWLILGRFDNLEVFIIAFFYGDQNQMMLIAI